MKPNNPGILGQSDLYFHTRSAQAKRMFFYLLCAGHYHCDKNYLVSRQSYDSFLIIYVQSGSGFAEQNGNLYSLKGGDFVFLDCYKPHSYYTHSNWEIYWIHFDGMLARTYFEQITQNGPLISPPNPYQGAHSLHKIFNAFHEQGKANEPLLSKHITDLLTELILCGSSNTLPANQASMIEDTLAYISENATGEITLEQLARHANLSLYYFSRVFKRETGFTPHEYIVQVRINFAKFYLKTTDLPVKEIAFRSGFNSECSFCTSFRKEVDMTPKNYRDYSI